ncbi:hypothetical protein FNYG_13269 [Fusarium nygamai]|uniref:Uncharacterized protein n=1 Tax=Gibberella nygamai TaxID=42673 RepID=A0A2K0VTL1_GIBNY|nr:hypothetical protein FNYG_13269 [Fusarium nygamai]
MDWALDSLGNSRPGSNSLPKEEAWSSLLDDYKPWRTYNKPITDPLHSLEEKTRLGHIYKVGTVTGATTGDFHHEKQDVKLADDNHLSEGVRNVVRAGYPTRIPGSSVPMETQDLLSLTAKEEIVGLFFSRHTINGSFDQGFGYATPIELVFQDIKEFSEHGITDIRIAQQ